MNVRFVRRPGLSLTLFVVAACVAACCTAGISHADQDSVSYVLEDFQTNCRLEDWYLPIPWGKSSEEVENVRVEGGRCVRLSWNDRAWRTSWVRAYAQTAPDETADRWIGYVLDRPTVGHLRSIRAWVFLPEANKGLPVRFSLADAEGKAFHTETISLDKPGWRLVTFPVSAGSPLQSPITIDKLLLGGKDSSGYVILDQIAVEVSGKPRELVTADLAPTDTDFVAGPLQPTYTLTVKNRAVRSVADLAVSITVKDAKTGDTVLSHEEQLGDLPAGNSRRISFTPAYGYGQFVSVAWETRDREGALPQAGGRIEGTRLFRDVSTLPAGPAERRFLTRWGKPGGVQWSCPLQRAGRTGAVWLRIVDPRWASLEIAPGEYDFDPVHELLDLYEHHAIDPVYASMLHTLPAFYDETQRRFAPAYGRLNRELSRSVGTRIQRYELGNETNGPNKYQYTEIARHGAAGLRSVSADTMIGNAGTAGLDIGFLQLQAGRGLYEYLDELVTHPYAFGASPEASKFHERYAGVDNLIDELGGMKFHYTTEWGWPHSPEVHEGGWYVDQETRAAYIVRHFAIAMAGGIVKDGLFAWDDHFGIYSKRRAFPAAASVNAYCAMSRAHQFAGWVQRDTNAWAIAFERAGRARLMAWSPDGRGTLSLTGRMDEVTVRDLYGNVIPVPTSDDALHIELNGNPLYVEGLPHNVLLSAWRDQAKAATRRYQRVLSRSGFKGDPDWEELAGHDNPGYPAIKSVLLAWQPQREIGYPEQAVIAQAIRRAVLAVRMEAVPSTTGATPREPDTVTRNHWRTVLRETHGEDVDIPPLRWTLSFWDKLSDEADMHSEAGQTDYASRLGRLDDVFHHVCGVLAERGHRVFFPIWPYVHASEKQSEATQEHLTFVPDRPVPVQLRLLSYASKAYEPRVTLELPEDWTCEPAFWEGTIQPDQQIDAVFRVTAGLTKMGTFHAALSIDGKPPVRVPFDSFDIQLPLRIELEPLETLLPGGPLVVIVTNKKRDPVSGRLRILSSPDTPPLAHTVIEDLRPNETRRVELNLPADTAVPPFNRWRLRAGMIVGPEQADRELTVDFACAAKASNEPVIDGDLQEWRSAPVLHLDKRSYTDNSFGADWSKEDLSAHVYALWDDRALYVAADVTDQLFQQGSSGAGVWAQDSIQIALSRDGKSVGEFALAKTPEGPQVWCYTSAAGQKGNYLVTEAKLAVDVTPGTGNARYECAIPWSAIFKEPPAAGDHYRFDVLLNDDDVIVPRRFMFRYGKGIVFTKNPEDFGYLRLLSEAAGPSPDRRAETDSAQIIFREDFEEYPEGTSPELWQTIAHAGPEISFTIRSGIGRDGSQALVLNNSVGSAPNVFKNLIRHLRNRQAAQPCVLRAWVKGRGVTDIGVASDVSGVQGFQYIPAWTPSEEWQQVTRDIDLVDGHHLMIRNTSAIKDLVIDDLELVQKP